MSTDPATLPRPFFIDADPAGVTARLVAAFEEMTGRTLLPAQPERLFLDWLAYQLALQRIAVQGAGERTLLAFAGDAALDHLGILVGVTRAEGESDARLRGRIREAPETFSVAGPVLAYKALAFGAAADIVDVAVWQPESGTVRVAILTATGSPDAELLETVAATLSAEKARPIGDLVEVVAPVAIPFTLDATITLRAGVDRPTVIAAVQAAAGSYVAERRAGLGRDLVPSQVDAALHVAGVHRVDLTAPTLRVLDGNEWADGVVGTLTFVAEGADG